MSPQLDFKTPQKFSPAVGCLTLNCNYTPLIFYIAKTTTEDLNFPKFYVREVLSVGQPWTKFAIKLVITVADDEW